MINLPCAVAVIILAAITTAEPIQPIVKQQNGIIIIHESNVLIRKGTYHARITINMSRSDKLREAVRMKSTFHDLCTAASSSVEDLKCELEYREIDKLIAKLYHNTNLNRILNLQNRSRTHKKESTRYITDDLALHRRTFHW